MTKKSLGILDLLGTFGFDRSCRAKLVRHQQAAKYDMDALRQHAWFELYQQYQKRPVFDELDRIVSFIGTKGTWARFVGVYDIKDSLPSRRGPMPADCPYVEWRKTTTRFYVMQRDPAFADLEDRVIIDWGPGTRSWHQRLANKPVIQITPPGQVLPPFDDYLEFSLTYRQLAAIFAAPDAHAEWRARLSAVAGVYLVLATTTGHQYVGSASGTEGIWGRWSCYARTGHGGNAKLKALCGKDPLYPASFEYSVLHVLPKTFSRAEVLAWEQRYKQKLGKRAVTLNVN